VIQSLLKLQLIITVSCHHFSCSSTLVWSSSHRRFVMKIFSLGPIQCLVSLSVVQASVLGFIFPEYEQLAEQSRDKKDVGPEPIKPCPGNERFCEEAEDYPITYKVNDDVVAAKLIKDTIFQSKKKDVDQQLSIRNFFKESRACDHRKSTVYPKKAKNVEGAFVFIVNDEQYRQAVDIEQCLGEGEPCRTDEDAPSFGTTVCRQKYATYKMYVINQEGEQVYDSFSLPSACLCHHKSNFAIRNDLKSEIKVDLPTCLKAEMLSIPKINQTTATATTTPTTITTEKTKKLITKNTAVRFQDRKRRQASVRLQPKKCSSSNNQNYCDSEDDYPKEIKNILLKAIQTNKELSVDLFQQLYDSKCKDQIQTRGFNIDEEQLCYGIPKIIYPRQAKNLDDKWRYVVNIDNYTQSVEIEECHNYDDYEDLPAEESDSVQFGENKEPTDFGVCLYSGAQGNNPDLTVCKQIYTEHKLLALSEEGQLLVDSFKLPSACACFVREDFILEFRRDMNDEEETKDDPASPTLPPQVEEDKGENFQFAG